MMTADVIIIGGGVIGCSIGRELSKYERKVLVLEQKSDVCEGTSKANSGIVHAGYDAAPGTRKAYFNLLGNRCMEEVCRELDVPFQRTGSLVLSDSEEGLDTLKHLYDQGIENGVPDMEILDRRKIQLLEPGITSTVTHGLFAKTAGIVCPFELTIAMAENAIENGAEIILNTRVTGIVKRPEGFRLVGMNKEGAVSYEAPIIINAAGVYADELHNMVSEHKLHIIPRRGEYCLLDKNQGSVARHTLFQLPTELGKGVLVTPTVHGNILLGPTALTVSDKEAVNTTKEGLERIIKLAGKSISGRYQRGIITSFAGLRAHEEKGDFVIGEAEDVPGFIDAAGIESPGLTCAPAIGKYIGELLQKIKPVPQKINYKKERKGMLHMAELSFDEQKKAAEENPAYGKVVCRCEMVTEGEILDAIHRPLPATTIDGIKRRTRAGMGRCQAGFCTSRTVELLAGELGIEKTQVTKNGRKSQLIPGKTKILRRWPE